MSKSGKGKIFDPVVDIVSLDDDERHPCCPIDPPERAEPTPAEDLKHPHKPRCSQAERELYQNRFEEL